MGLWKAIKDAWAESQAEDTDKSRGHDGDPTAPPSREGWWTRDAWFEEWGPPQNLVVGESFRQTEIRALAGPGGERCLRLVDVQLHRDRGNSHDPQAIAARVDGVLVGYLRRDLSQHVLQALHGDCDMILAGVMRGGEALDVGVHVWPEQRLDPGPPLPVPGSHQRHVSWPPTEDELAVMRRNAP